MKSGDKYGNLTDMVYAQQSAYTHMRALERDEEWAAKAFDYLKTVANLVKDGELDDDGSVFEMTNDDAYDTVHAIITSARALTDTPDREEGEYED